MANLEASAEGPTAGTPSRGPPIVSAVQLDAATMQAIISGVAAHLQISRERDIADNGGEFFSKSLIHQSFLQLGSAVTQKRDW